MTKLRQGRGGPYQLELSSGFALAHYSCVRRRNLREQRHGLKRGNKNPIVPIKIPRTGRIRFVIAELFSYLASFPQAALVVG